MDNISFISKACHQEWQRTHNWNTCKLNRREYGEFLLNYLLGEPGEFVLNLNGTWGSGKTEFLKRLYVAALERGHPAIYINAWESDFSQQPLVVVASELLEQLNCFNENIGEGFDEAKKAFGRFIRGSIIVGAAALSHHLTGEVEFGKAAAENMLGAEMPPETLMDGLSKNHAEQKATMQEIRKRLTALAEVLETNLGAKLPILVLVDELDRCRPTYAIEMLEVIKHFFSVDKLVFVVATDTDQLSHSIKAVYGEGFDADTYLRRFFQQRAKLPEPDLMQYILAKYSEEDFTYGNSDYLFGMHWEFIVEVLAGSASTQRLSIRSLDAILLRAKAIMRYFKGRDSRPFKPVCLLILFLGLFEHEVQLKEFEIRNDYDRVPFMSVKLEKLGDAIRGSMIAEVCSDILCPLGRKDPLDGDRVTYTIPSGSPSDLQESRDVGNSKNFASESRLRAAVSQWHSQFQSKYQSFRHPNIFLLWTDYKKMIELSDTLTI